MCKGIKEQKKDYELLIQETKCDACKNSCPFSINNVGVTAAKFLSNQEESLPNVVLLAENQVISTAHCL